MRFSVTVLIVIFALLSTAHAQQSNPLAALSQIPKCALDCLLKSFGESSCAITDTKCLCNDAQLQRSAEGCITRACSIKDSLTAQNVSSTMCGKPVRDRSESFRVTNITLIVISSMCVALRLGFKALYSATELGWDDYTILATLFVGLPCVILNDLATLGHGLGRDIWVLQFAQIGNFIKDVYVTTVLYFLALTLLKLSLLCFYLRIFADRKIVKIIWGTIVFNICVGIAFVLVAIFQCRPIDYLWLHWDDFQSSHCVDINAVGWSNAAIGIALDLWMLAIPFSQVRGLNLSWKKKLSVVLMFSVGTFVTVVAIIRLSSLVKASTMNPTWDQWSSILWSTIEVNVGIICTCMPTLRLIFIRALPRIFDSTKNQSKTSHGHKKSSNWSSGLSRSTGTELGTVEPEQPTQQRDSVAEHDRSSIPENHHGDDEVELLDMSPSPRDPPKRADPNPV